MAKVLLISMPWAHHYMPSIQLGALKAYLQVNDVDCDAAHIFLEIADAIGFSAYSGIWFPYPEDGEALYSFVMFPEMRRMLSEDPYFSDKIASCRKLQQESTDRYSMRLELSSDFVNAFDDLHDQLLQKHNIAAILWWGLH